MGKNGGTEKAPIFLKTKKMGNLNKKKGRKMERIKKPAHFKKMGTRKIQKMGQRLVGAKNSRFLLIKRWGENGRKVKILFF